MLIGEFQKNTVERVRVCIEQFKGYELIDIRAHFEEKDGTWRPTRKGIAIPPAKVGELVVLLREAVKKASE